MEHDTFTVKWTQKERDLGLDRISRGMILFEGGALPREAAPCLSFNEVKQAPRLWEVFGAASNWSEKDRIRLGTYRMIGSDGAGNPVCIEESSGIVWVLEHEDGFRSRMFMNTSIPQLAECLLAYMGENDADRFGKLVHEIDIPALSEGTFWWHEREGLSHAEN